MKDTVSRILEKTIEKHPPLLGQKDNILNAFYIINEAFNRGNKLLLCGNGGSASDCEHIAGELLKSFKKKRKIRGEVYCNLDRFGKDGKLLQNTLEGALPVISLTSHTAFNTAFLNDKSPQAAFAQQCYALSRDGDVLLAISTSGNSKNCVLAAITAKAAGCKIVVLTGKNESELFDLADVTVRVPETETYLVQELHLPVYHCLCAMLEEENF